MNTSASRSIQRGFTWPLPKPLMTLGATAALILLLYWAGWVIAQIAGMVSEVLLPVIIGALFASLLMPVQLFFNHMLRLQRYLASAITVLGTMGLIGGVIYMTGSQIAEGMGELADTVVTGIYQVQNWLINGPLHVQPDQITGVVHEIQAWLKGNTTTVTSGVLSATSSVGNLLIGVLISAIMCLFFLAEGDRMLSYGLMLISSKHRDEVREAIRRGWVTLGTWARTQVVVSAVDAIGISLGLLVLQLPFVVPLGVLTFLVCFIPMLGAWLSGVLVVLVALVFKGPVAALIIALWVLVVQQVESHAMAPLLMGKAVNVHPLAILLGVTLGTYLMGLPGALLTVPTIAVGLSMFRYWQGRDPFPGLAAGKSALLDSPRDLVADTKPEKMPKRIGEITPQWVENRFVEATNSAREYAARLRAEAEAQD